MKIARLARSTVDLVLVIALFLATLFPLIDALGRIKGGFYIPGGAAWLQQFTLWITFLGGLVATREEKHLRIAAAEIFKGRAIDHVIRVATHALAAAVCAILAYASVQLIIVNREEDKILSGGVPVWVSECMMPAAVAIIALMFLWKSSSRWLGRIAAIVGALAIGTLGIYAPDWTANHAWLLTGALVVLVLLGAPVFVGMSATALLWFFSEGTAPTAVSAEIYRLIASPTLPAIPLLTAAGFILAESKASTRLLRLFRAGFGWMPGGIAVVVIAICAMFTTFTGGSGVTILAVGGLVMPMLLKENYSEKFSLGLVTSSGSLGLLFPPSLPVILYSVAASTSDNSVPANALYIGGVVPGALIAFVCALYAIFVGRGNKSSRIPFSFRELLAAIWEAKWEWGLPVFMIALFARGHASMIETASAAVLYAVVVECFIHRDIRFFAELPGVIIKSLNLTGAVLILLAVAMGMTSYLVDAQIPDMMTEWVKAHIHGQFAFLLALNALLIVVGSFVEIYAAIIILAPLIAPMGLEYGVHPVHLGIIFLANLELGFLAPPLGLNLIISSSRFNKPVFEVARTALPFLFIQGVALAMITYVPALTMSAVKFFGM